MLAVENCTALMGDDLDLNRGTVAPTSRIREMQIGNKYHRFPTSD
jgi:hypothetical protein